MFSISDKNCIPIKFGIGNVESGDLGHLQLRLRYRWKALDPRMKACYALSPTWGPGRGGGHISGSFCILQLQALPVLFTAFSSNVLIVIDHDFLLQFESISNEGSLSNCRKETGA